MRKILFYIALLAPSYYVANPAAHAQASLFDKWIPSGWKVIRIAHGDLAHEGMDDIAIIIEKNDNKNYIKNDKGLGDDNLNLNPRRLIVLQVKQGAYEKIIDNDQFIPSENSEKEPCLLDPLKDGNISISSRQTLTIELHYFSTCGGWSTSVKTWKFHYQNGRFRLIGMDDFIHYRNSGSESKISTNFLTGKIKETSTTPLDNYKNPIIIWKNMSGRQIFYLNDISLTFCESNENFADLCP